MTNSFQTKNTVNWVKVYMTTCMCHSGCLFTGNSVTEMQIESSSLHSLFIGSPLLSNNVRVKVWLHQPFGLDRKDLSMFVLISSRVICAQKHFGGTYFHWIIQFFFSEMKLSRKFMSNIISGLRWASFEKYATFNPSPLSLKQLLEFGKQTKHEQSESNVSPSYLMSVLPLSSVNLNRLWW